LNMNTGEKFIEYVYKIIIYKKKSRIKEIQGF